MKNKPKIRGFSLFELLVVICIVSVLSVILLDRLIEYQERAEKAAMQQVAGSIQSALTLRFAKLVTSGQERLIPGLVNENPMNWLARVPENYEGEFFGLDESRLRRGNWGFDTKSKELVYVVDRDTMFDPKVNAIPSIRYRTRLVTDDAYGRSGNNTGIAGVILEPVSRYSWFGGQ